MSEPPYTLDIPRDATLAEVERRYILHVLGQHNGWKPGAAAALGICLKTLYNKLGRYRRAAKPETWRTRTTQQEVR